MTTAQTRQNIRRELYNRIPGLGFTGTADSLTGATLTDTYVFKDATAGANAYRGMYLYRPDRTGDDLVRKIITLAPSTGVITVVGSAYSDTADTNYEVVGLLHPDELNACIQRAMNYVFMDVQVPLCGRITDGDMDDTSTNWNASSGNISLSKVTTASRVFSGFRALRGVNVATNQYAESNQIKVFEGETFFLSTVVHAATGTAQLTLWNNTASSAINTAVTSGETGFAHLWVTGQIPTGCEIVTVRLYGQENNADLYWNHAALYSNDDTQFPAPSWLDEQYKFLKLREANYRRSISGQTNGGYDDANSRWFEDWRSPSMFSLDPFHKDSNPYAVQLKRTVGNKELWIQGQRPFSDLETLSSDSATTLAPLEQVYAHAKLIIVKTLKARYPSDKRWAGMLEDANMDVAAEDGSRPDTPDYPIKREHNGRV